LRSPGAAALNVNRITNRVTLLAAGLEWYKANMNIAFCHENVLPERGGCETYIADLARRLIADRHEVHLYACRRDETALPPALHFHPLPAVRGPRFLRPWLFGARCLAALAGRHHDVTVGFDKIWDLDILYPQGGLHTVSAEQNVCKHGSRLARGLARLLKMLDLAHWSYRRVDRRQYLGRYPTQIVVNSEMVRHHFAEHLRISPDAIKVVRSAIDAARFPQHDRLRRRQEGREQWGIAPEEVVGLFVAKNSRLKGLSALLHALAALLRRTEFRAAAPPLRLLVCGDDRCGPFEREAARLGVAAHVRFAGQFPDIRTAFFSADFLAHPTFYDPCSLVVLEAMACDLPVITSRYNGASELMHPLQEGYVIDDPHDDAHLAWCLAQLLDPARRRACAHAARRTAAQWTFEHHYRQMLQVFQEVVERKNAA
jgi:UDP-glucose:(heptosyl)LPS alpha-1,3-glucosyltransferase